MLDAGATVHLHDDHIEQNVEDHIWLTEVGKRGWLVITKDQWIRRRTIEREALLSANLKVFCFMSGSIPFSEMAEALVKSLPAMKMLASKTPPPFIAGIYKDGTARILIGDG